MSTEHQQRLMAFAVRNAAPEATSLEIIVYDVIGKDFFGEGIGAADVVAKLRSAPKAKAIDLRINSLGGILNDAKAMVNLLNERAANGVTITGYVDGLAASSAAYLLTATTRVVMPANAFLMVHGVRGGVRGTAEDLESGAALMRAENEKLAAAFAAMSASRGKTKNKADFLKAFAGGDLYLDADEAIAWGLADEKLEALKVAACLVDISTFSGVPEALKGALYVATGANDPRLLNGPELAAPLVAPPAPAPPQIPPAPEARQPTPANLGEENSNTMSLSKLIITALALSDDADENAAAQAIGRLKASASVGAQIEQLLGATGAAALGAVRALQEERTQNAALGNEVAKLKIVNARREFEGNRDGGLKDKKLTPATAKLYNERFEDALKLAEGEDGDTDLAAAKAADICADLKGFLAVAPRIVSSAIRAPDVDGNGSQDGAPVLINGKRFEELKPLEQKRVKDANPELYNAAREDAQARGAV